MTLLLAISASVIFAVSVYLLTSRDLKSVAMGVFLISHAAHLGIVAMSGQPLLKTASGAVVDKGAPVLGTSVSGVYADPLPQALVLTSIVISFAVMAFMLTLLVATHRRTGSLEVDDLAGEDRPAFPTRVDEPAPARGGSA
jgi:multicomponent Na+:H+ antiporter subunit C